MCIYYGIQAFQNGYTIFGRAFQGVMHCSYQGLAGHRVAVLLTNKKHRRVQVNTVGR
jgi:hypothetical protein